MTICRIWLVSTVLSFGLPYACVAAARPDPARVSQAAMDRDLMEITVSRLEALYSRRTYTVTEVVR